MRADIHVTHVTLGAGSPPEFRALLFRVHGACASGGSSWDADAKDHPGSWSPTPCFSSLSFSLSLSHTRTRSHTRTHTRTLEAKGGLSSRPDSWYAHFVIHDDIQRLFDPPQRIWGMYITPMHRETVEEG